MSAEKKPDVIVVGAGIVGAACAYLLAKRKLSVLVLDSRFPGAGVTAAGMGHLVVMDDSEAQFALTACSRRLWSELAAALPPDCEDDPCGTLWIAADEEEMNTVRRKAAFYGHRGIQTEILDGRALAAEEPNLRPGLAGALLVPGDRVLYPPNAARWLMEEARRLGVEFRGGCTVTGIDATSARHGDRRIEAAAIVNAAGPEAPHLTPGLPIEPRKGHLVITDRYPGFCRHQLVELGYLNSAHSRTSSSVAFNAQPRSTGQILLGSSREFAGWETTVNPQILGRMIRRGIEFMPALANLSAVRAWTGFRPATPDNLPLIGRWSNGQGPGPWIAAGHEGLGITTALATGHLIAALISGSTPQIDPSPFAPNRPMPGLVH
ncbi:MAG: NAD(P)/FAD-dependent oxidoreductase [Thermoanaerobaculia bacterium]